MCQMSVISGGFRNMYPDPRQFPLQIHPELSKIFVLVQSIDAKLGAKDCQDAEKAAWWAEIEARVKALEETAVVGGLEGIG